MQIPSRKHLTTKIISDKFQSVHNDVRSRLQHPDSRVGKMLTFMSKVHAGGTYRRLLVFTGVYWNLPAFTDIAGFLLLFLVLAQN